MSGYRKKLIEVALPLEAINRESTKEKSVPRRGHPQTIHLWWARRPLASARSVLFAQLVNDPSEHPEQFPDEHSQAVERTRLFSLLEQLASWENVNNELLLDQARAEIARTWAHGAKHTFAERVIRRTASKDEIRAFLQDEVPPICDPFTGGGTICLEAQRLGLRTRASDLNPVAVTINKALLDIPMRFRNRPPVHPNARQQQGLGVWDHTSGLATDVHEYSSWILSQARSRLSQYYPKVRVPKELGGGSAAPIGWMWARTVASPNPMLRGAHVPLVASFWISNKKGNQVWIEPVINKSRTAFQFEVRRGSAIPTLGGTVDRRGAKCILSGSPIPLTYIRDEASSGRMSARLMAVVIPGASGRTYVSPTAEANMPVIPEPTDPPSTSLPEQALGFRVQKYGVSKHRDLFSPRQLMALCTFSDLVREVHGEVLRDALAAGMEQGAPYEENGMGAVAYADAVTAYLALSLGRLADYNSTVCTWNTIGGSIRSTFARQAIPMTWDYYETNPLADTTGSWASSVSWVEDVLRNIRPAVASIVGLRDARTVEFPSSVIVSTDPPYYDNIGYADLSDFFYVWLRRSLRDYFPFMYSTVLVPKSAELVATPFRFDGSRERAHQFFESGMRSVFLRMFQAQDQRAPLTIYYAFKQTESEEVNEEDTGVSSVASSTGWETMLSALVASGFLIDGTWPVRSERLGRTRDIGSNALASSIVLVCRKRPDDAPTTTRGDFRRMLRKELPDALKKLQQGNIAPVDVAQASIGPGMAIFSRHKHVLEADGKPMTVRSALQLINEVLDEYLASGEGDFDAYTRFAITWYEQHGWDPGPFGEAETLAKARNVAVNGVVEAGICKSAAGKVRILKRDEMRPIDYDPATDQIPTVWEFTQHLIRNLESDGEEAAAYLLKKLGPAADATRELAYRLYNTCERRKWAEDARSYNGLILAWPELEKLVTQIGNEPPPPPKTAEKAPAKKGAAKRKNTRQQSLFDDEDS